ncbi:MAG: matrixin family metalloprotease [Acidobacteriota bacterium]|nr:matrixin family metalloprotease [Acidobacteriota bacterium]
MRRLAIALLLTATLTLTQLPARAYTLQFTDAPNSVQIRWPSRNIKVALSTSLGAPQTNIKSGSDVLGAARRALASGTRGDGLSLITVAHTAENTEAFAGEGSEMPGRTRVFNTIAGSITEADIALNPSQPFSTDATPGTYDLEATFTHEIGHLLGLEHSAVLGATMQPRAARNGIYNLPALSARTLSEDDRAGARALYGPRLGSGARGSIQGTVDFVSGAPVFGANVWAEEAATGRVAASSITLSNGAYRMEGLLPGEYRVFAGPLGGAVNSSEIASQRGAYAALAFNQQFPFRAEEIGRVTVEPHSTAQLNAQISGLPSLVNPSFIGINRELSTVALPLVPGQAYKLFLGGGGIKASQLSGSGVTATSPFIIVDSSSLKDEDFGEGINVISFDVMLAGDIQAGEYSLRLQTAAGDVAYVVGGLTIDGPESVAEAEQGAPTDDGLGMVADESVVTDYE